MFHLTLNTSHESHEQLHCLKQTNVKKVLSLKSGAGNYRSETAKIWGFYQTRCIPPLRMASEYRQLGQKREQAKSF
jgi:hypothetical protein